MTTIASANTEDKKEEVKKEEPRDIHGKEAAKPGEPTTPWKPSNKLDLPFVADPAYHYRWVSKERLGNRLGDGWEIVSAVDEGKALEVNRNLISGSDLDNTIQRNELILCRVRRELKEQMDEYYKQRTDAQLAASVNELNKAQSEASGNPEDRAPGEITIK